VIYDIFDYYADHLRITPAWIKNLIRYVDKKCIGWADGVILVDDVRQTQITGSRPKRCTVIYNTPIDQFEAFQEQRHDAGGASFRLAYVGLLQMERGLCQVLTLMGRHSTWLLDLAGFGGDEDLLRERFEGMPNVRWHGRVAYSRALELSAQADVLFATYDPAIQNHRFASPNKVFEAMMLGKPVVVARGTHVDKLVEQYDCGLVVEYGDVTGLEWALSRLSEDSGLRSRLGDNARQAYEANYRWSVMAARLRDLYAAVLT
jgi:glycosyltransferase involved in cell wall biosynthesis